MSDKNQINELLNRVGMDLGRLRRELEELDPDSLSLEEKEDWYRVRGAIEFRNGNRSRAYDIYKEGLRYFPDSPTINFGLGQEYEWKGDIEGAKSYFKKVKIRDVGGPTILAISRYFYLWDQIDEALETIQQIFDTYYELKIADDHYLYVRGLPFFSVGFGNFATYMWLKGDLEYAINELEKAKKILSDLSSENIENTLDAYRLGDWHKVVDACATSKHGYGLMRKAIIESRVSNGMEEALAILNSVELKEEDFPWLEDIRILGLAEVAHRFGEKKREEQLIESFIRKQSLLFEPDHAFYFGFIEYQETLKGRYQSLRMKNS